MSHDEPQANQANTAQNNEYRANAAYVAEALWTEKLGVSAVLTHQLRKARAEAGEGESSAEPSLAESLSGDSFTDKPTWTMSVVANMHLASALQLILQDNFQESLVDMRTAIERYFATEELQVVARAWLTPLFPQVADVVNQMRMQLGLLMTGAEGKQLVLKQLDNSMLALREADVTKQGFSELMHVYVTEAKTWVAGLSIKPALQELDAEEVESYAQAARKLVTVQFIKVLAESALQQASNDVVPEFFVAAQQLIEYSLDSFLGLFDTSIDERYGSPEEAAAALDAAVANIVRLEGDAQE